MTVAILDRLRAALSSLLPRASWLVGGLVHQVGWPGVTGIFLLVAGSAGLLYSGFWLETTLERERAVLEEASRLAKARPAAPAEVRAAPSVRLDQFYADFPDLQEIPASLRAVLQIATDKGMALDQGQYRLVGDAGGPMLRYHLTLPMRGSYRQLRAFIEQAMAELPALALDSVEFRREAVGATELESVVEFSLYVHPR
jgi:Tfp pilus assembly protein PilO